MWRILAALLFVVVSLNRGTSVGDPAGLANEPAPRVPLSAHESTPDVAADAVPPMVTTPAVDPSPLATEPALPQTQPSVSADGTTSVVVPSEPMALGGTSPPLTSRPPTDSSSGPPNSPLNATGQPTAVPQGPPYAPPPAVPSPPPSDATAVLAALLEPLAGPPGGSLPPAYARPLPLLEPLVRSGDRSRRLWIVQAYWKVATGYAGVRCTTEALERLELVAPGGDPHDRATLDVATAAARADLADTNARLGAAQQELVDLARLPQGEPPPWPIDRPLADPYQTRFEEIFANRIATGRVRAIVRTLPARHAALSARAAAVKAADHAMRMAEADHAKGNRPIEAVIAAHSAVVGQQAAFLEAVRSYNLEIAEYAMAVADLSLPDEQFVSMLIASPTVWQSQPADAATTARPPTASGLPPDTGPAASEYLMPTATVLQVE